MDSSIKEYRDMLLGLERQANSFLVNLEVYYKKLHEYSPNDINRKSRYAEDYKYWLGQRDAIKRCIELSNIFVNKGDVASFVTRESLELFRDEGSIEL